MLRFGQKALSATALLFLSPLCGQAATFNVCSVPELRFSPTGKFVYVQTNYDLRIVRTECLMSAVWKDCEVGDVPTNSQIATFFFSDNDSRITTTTEKLGNSLANKDGPKWDWVETFSTDAIMEGKSVPLSSEKNRGDGTEVEGFFDVDPAEDTAGRELQYVGVYRTIARQADRLPASAAGANSRNIYGAVFGQRYVYLYRDDRFDMYVSDNVRDKAFLHSAGNAFYERQTNIPFKFSADRAFARVAGTIKMVSGAAAFSDAGGPYGRQAFINGERPLGYYGIYSPEAVQTQNVDETLATALSQTAKQLDGRPVTGIAVNTRRNAYIYSYQSAIADFDLSERERNAFSHVIQFEGKTVTIGCQDDDLRKTVKKVGPTHPTWIESYTIEGAKKTAIYIHGGPVEYQGSEDTAQINLFLKHGYNVDVVNYGGSNYTFDTATRMNSLGEASLRRDVQNIEDYVKVTYHDRKDLVLYQESFGGVFYRFFSASFFDKFNRVVLYAPRGSEDRSNYSRVLQAYAQKTYGSNLYISNLDASYYRELKSCQIKSPTLLIIGDKDTNVNASYDYRYCLDSPLVTLHRHPGWHGGNSRENFQRVFQYLND